MVSNFDRILGEIRREADLIAPHHGLQPDSVVELVMRIVDLEDRNRIRSVTGIKSKIRGMIEEVALAETPKRD